MTVSGQNFESVSHPIMELTVVYKETKQLFASASIYHSSLILSHRTTFIGIFSTCLHYGRGTSGRDQ